MQTRGFSLIELIFSMAVMGLLMAVMVPAFGKVRDRALETSVKAVALSIQTSIETYGSDNNLYPDGSYSVADLSSALISAGALSSVPQNPFTQATYTSSDSAGKIVYASVSDGSGYTLTAYKRDGATVLLTVAGGTAES